MIAALVQGLPYARTRVRDGVQVGFSLAEPAEWLGGDNQFWRDLSSPPASAFAAHVDYVGLGLYPNGFPPPPRRPRHPPPLRRNHLRVCLAKTRFPPDLPIHIAEAGSPSGAYRTPAGRFLR